MKNLKQQALLFLLLGIFQGAQAQKTILTDYKFNDETIAIPEGFKSEEEIVLERNHKVEFNFDNNQSTEYYLFHEKKQLNSDAAIERNNRVYIPYAEKENLIANKLRVILPNGKKIELKNSDIKKEVNEESGMSGEYFAVNGLEKGAIIERFYIIKSPADLTGTTFYMQSQYPIAKISLEIIYPNHLTFASKSYNKLPEATINKEAYSGKTNMFVEQSNIPSLNEDEQYSNWRKNAMSIRYKLLSNQSRNLENLYTHKDYVSATFDNYYAELSKKDIQNLEKFVAKIPKNSDPLLYIRSVEDLIKSNIQYNRYFKLNKTVSDILTNKQGTLFDLTKLYVAVLNQLNLEHELVLTTDKSKTVFDPEFETYENIKKVLIYNKTTDSYIEPEAINYRTPLIDYSYLDNYGLFVGSKTYQNIKMPVSTTRKIEVQNDLTHDYMDMIIDASKGIDQVQFSSRIKFGGHTAAYLQIVKESSNAKEYDDMLQFFVKQYASEFTPKAKVTTKNDGVNNVALKPFEIHIDVEGNELISKAGTNYLVKIGSVIGKQMQMYSEKERQLPIELNYPHYYTRTITFLIPEGYTIKNPEILKIDYSLKKEDKTLANFTTDYKLENNKLVVYNTENYDFINLPVSDYPTYRQVINAAADFQKLNLILEKK